MFVRRGSDGWTMRTSLPVPPRGLSQQTGLAGKDRSEQNYWSWEVLGPVRAVHPIVSWLSVDELVTSQNHGFRVLLNPFESIAGVRVCLDKWRDPESRVIECRWVYLHPGYAIHAVQTPEDFYIPWLLPDSKNRRKHVSDPVLWGEKVFCLRLPGYD